MRLGKSFNTTFRKNCLSTHAFLKQIFYRHTLFGIYSHFYTRITLYQLKSVCRLKNTAHTFHKKFVQKTKKPQKIRQLQFITRKSVCFSQKLFQKACAHHKIRPNNKVLTKTSSYSSTSSLVGSSLICANLAARASLFLRSSSSFARFFASSGSQSTSS